MRWKREAELQSELATAALAHCAEQRRQYESRIADLKESKEEVRQELLRTIKALADEVEYLRAQHFGPRTSPLPTAATVRALPDEHDFMPTANPLYMSEEEEDLRALHDAGQLDDIEFRRILDTIRGVTRTDIQVESL